MKIKQIWKISRQTSERWTWERSTTPQSLRSIKVWRN